VSSDSRKLAQGDLFIALRGEHFDGYDFVATALQPVPWPRWSPRTATKHTPRSSITISLLLVGRYPSSRWAIGRYWRRQFDIPLVAITAVTARHGEGNACQHFARGGGQCGCVLATKAISTTTLACRSTLLHLKRKPIAMAVIEWA